MKVNIFLNGEKFLGKIEPAEQNIVCDGAYEYCKEKDIKIDTILGDFDSLNYIPSGAITYKTNKDFTDGEGAVNFVKDYASEVVFYNFGGLREDHFLGNLSLLILCDKLKIKAKAVTNYSQIYFVKKSINLTNVKDKTISIVPYSKKVHILKGKGLKYSVDKLSLYCHKTIGISNEATEDSVEIKLKKGMVFVIVNN